MELLWTGKPGVPADTLSVVVWELNKELNALAERVAELEKKLATAETCHACGIECLPAGQ